MKIANQNLRFFITRPADGEIIWQQSTLVPFVVRLSPAPVAAPSLFPQVVGHVPEIERRVRLSASDAIVAAFVGPNRSTFASVLRNAENDEYALNVADVMLGRMPATVQKRIPSSWTACFSQKGKTPMNTNPQRLENLRTQARCALSELRALREREARVLSDRRGMMADDYRLPQLDGEHLRLVKKIRDAETVLAPLQSEIDELEKAEQQAAAKSAAVARAAGETEIAQAVKDRLEAAAKIDAALALLADGFRAWDAAGNVLAKHEGIHGRASQAIFAGRTIRAAIHAASEGTNLPRALELSRAFDGCATALESEIGLWAAYLPKKNAA